MIFKVTKHLKRQKMSLFCNVNNKFSNKRKNNNKERDRYNKKSKNGRCNKNNCSKRKIRNYKRNRS